MGRSQIPPSIFFTIALLGIWLIATPATFAFESHPLTYSNYLCGALLLVLAERCRRHPIAKASNKLKPLHPKWIWAIVAIGIWLQISPLLFWAPQAAAYLNDTFVGSWLITLAITIHPLPGEFPSPSPTIPPGWSYNPSAWTQRVPIAFLAFICWMISRYLSAYQLGYIDTVWDPFFSPGTKGVLESDISKSFPVSDAGLGAFAYTIEFFTACQGSETRWRTAPWLVLVFGILVIPVSFVSAILIILQPVAVGTWCTLCLATAVCMLIAIPFAVGEVAASLQYLRSARKTTPLHVVLFQGGPCPKETPDKSIISIHSSFSAIMKSALSGITFPWNLSLCSLCGICLLALPSLLGLEGLLFNTDPILGALVTMNCVLAFAEYARQTRWANMAFAFLLILAAFSYQETGIILLHFLLALLIASFSVRKGPIRQKSSMPYTPSI